ncbi:MAG: hypothetical protein ACI8QD_002138 [Cyclobacteriaceae bacterium]|jgi:hypothetical protein
MVGMECRDPLVATLKYAGTHTLEISCHSNRKKEINTTSYCTYKLDNGLQYQPRLLQMWYPTSSSNTDYIQYQSHIKLETQRENFSDINFQDYSNKIIQAYIDYRKQLTSHLEVVPQPPFATQSRQ